MTAGVFEIDVEGHPDVLPGNKTQQNRNTQDGIEESGDGHAEDATGCDTVVDSCNHAQPQITCNGQLR
jgi:hypothetical protein